jgi:hypothetical protein
MSGRPTEPASLVDLTPAELGVVEPELIADFVREPGYLMRYEHWPRISHRQPVSNPPGPVTIEVEVNDFPLQVPLTELWIEDGSVDFSGEARLLNHAGYYLQ